MSEPSFSIAQLRAEMGLTLAEMAARVGLKSVGHMSEIEATNRCSLRVALGIEEISQGRIKAATLSDDVALVVETLARSSGIPQHRPTCGTRSSGEVAACVAVDCGLRAATRETEAA